jgi:hypothetical protein
MDSSLRISCSVSTCTYIKETAHHYLLTLLEISCSFWSPKIIKDDFEAAVIKAIKKKTPLLVTVICI